MLPKDFENYELRIQKLRELSRESLEAAQKIFQESYERRMESLLPENILGTKKLIRSFCTIELTECLRDKKAYSLEDILQRAIKKSVSQLPLTSEGKQSLQTHMFSYLQRQERLGDTEPQSSKSLQMNPDFPLIESIFADGKLSQEEFFLIQQHYQLSQSLTSSLQKISPRSRQNIEQEQAQLSVSTRSLRKQEFESEYAASLQHLEVRGYQVQQVVPFVAQSYYRPKNRFESSKERLKRTWKIALLKLIQTRFGSINIEALLKKFELCESFEDFFLLLYKLFEILEEDSEAQTSFHQREEKDEVHNLLQEAQARKQKILAGEKVTARMGELFAQDEAHMEQAVLDKLLLDGTHFIGQEVHFGHEQTLAGVYAQAQESVSESEEDEIDEIVASDDTLLGKYSALKEYFFELDTQKRKAFALGDMLEIDRLNDILFRLDSQIQKLSQILGESQIPETELT